MAEQRTLTVYRFEEKTGEIHRRRINGEDLLEDKPVAKYDPEKQILTFPNKNFIRLYKLGVITFLAENELLIKSYQLADIKPDAPLGNKKEPARPKKTPKEGDKTPAVVEWYLKYRWNEFCARYGYRGKYSGVVVSLEPLWEPRPGDRVPEYRGQEKVKQTVHDALVTDRKTHLSFLPEECVGDEEKGILPWDEDEPEAEGGTPDLSARGAGKGDDE